MTPIDSDENYNLTAYFENGDIAKVYGSKLFYLGLTNFKGWKCDAGFTRIVILPGGNVYSSECYNDLLGNLEDGTFKLLDSPTTCNQVHCTNNPDDVMSKKNKTDK
jgi:hypothetical protein